MNLLREHFKHDGSPKKAYASKNEAVIAARSQITQEPYYCTFCNKWHLATKVGMK